MIDKLAGRLAELAALGQTISYGDLARELELPSPAIARLTTMLETLMEQDAAAGRPFRAALCMGRFGDGMPAIGFFEKAAQLDAVMTADPAKFVQNQRRALQMGA
jgi:hypothetical protein